MKKKKTTLREALGAWATHPAGEAGEHIPPAELYEFLRQPGERAGEVLAHLESCPRCAQELRQMQESLAQAEERLAGWDVAWPKAAASPQTSTQRILTEAGKYTIEIHPHTVQRNRGIITLQVSPQYRALLEGKRVSLKDGEGRVLLEGKIVNGEAAQEVEGLDRIDVGFVVRSE